VAFTVGLLRDSAYPGPADQKRLWQSIQVTISNTQVIAFTLPEKFAPFLDYTSFGLLPQHLLSDVTAGKLSELDFNRQPVGSGPFRFSNWIVESGRPTGVVLSASPDNYERSLLNQVQFNFYADPAAAMAAYQNGVVLGVSRLDGAQVKTALQLPQLGLHTSILPEYSLIYLNQSDPATPFFKEKKVRQALLAGLNRREMAADILGGQAVLANSPIVPGSWAYNSELPIVEYNPQAAVSLLENSGWVFPEGALPGTESYVRQKDGVPLAFTLITPDDPVHVALAESARQTWTPLGIKVEVTPVDPAVIRSAYLEARAFQAALVDFNLAGTPDPDPYPFWHETQAESGQNYSGFKDRLTSEYLEQARITADITARARLYQSFQSRFADQVPALLLCYPVYNYAVDTKVNGVQIGPLTQPSDRFNTLARWYLITLSVIVEQPNRAPTPTP
jgi:peptide/nickel transport system substrate-binding protein